MREAFFAAVRRDDVAEVRRFLADNFSLAKARWPGRGRPDGMMRSLGPKPYNRHSWLPAPSNPDDPGDPRYTSLPLHWTRNDEMVQVLVEAEADVNAKGTSGDIELPEWFLTPLWRAAHDGRMESVRLLVAQGADVNYLDPDDCNQALHTAAENGHPEVCRFLVMNGARPDIISAAMIGMVDAVEELLEAAPSQVHRVDQHGRSPLDAATLMDSFRVSWPQTDAHCKIARLLLASGAQLELSHAASLGWIDQAKQLVEADPQLLHRKRLVPELLTGGASMESPLQAARRRGHSEVVQFLSARGAQ
jgi:ankyrin repeat protein